MGRKGKRKGYFIQKSEEWLESLAYRSLSLAARCLLDEFQIIYRPNRNGQLSISTRRAADRLKVSLPTVMKAFKQLELHGFIELTEPQQWLNGKAREYRLTIETYNDCEPTDNWRKWSADDPVSQ